MFASGGQADAELQILMTDNSDTTKFAVLSFLIKTVGDNKGYQNAKKNFNVINSITHDVNHNLS